MIRTVPAETLRIRQATHQDLEQVQEFTKNTFSWGDYLPRVWGRWVDSAHGHLLVAESNGQLVGTVRVCYLGNAEAWLEGVRVRHEFRNRGIASCLVQAAHERAIRKKCRVIRLETFVHNTPAHRVFEKFGYLRLVQYTGLEIKAQRGELNSVRAAKLADAEACWDLWQHSWLKRYTHGIVPADFGWRWWEFTPERLMGAIRGERVWVTPSNKTVRGFMVTRQDDSFDATVLSGTPRAATTLFEAAKTLAANAEQESVYWLAPDTAPAKKWAAQAGFTPDEEGLLVYACKL